MKALNRIYQNLQSGFQYGTNINNARYPYFHCVLSISPTKQFIRYNNFGSSACKNTINDLSWIIETIFKTTAEEFEKQYTIHNNTIN